MLIALLDLDVTYILGLTNEKITIEYMGQLVRRRKVSEDFMEEREQDFPSLEKFEKLEGELSLFDQKVVLDQKLLKLDQ
ncbi:hypothetical protein [Limnobacter sp.]|uniref:hypothetical protein n=1 Tax=Limnobacter sp. TaxID=2003368 RepID=UPI00311EC333